MVLLEKTFTLALLELSYLMEKNPVEQFLGSTLPRQHPLL